jgi:hypothetical protein
MSRILRGLGSRALPCGCLIGLYETYAKETVAIVDARGISCANELHRVDANIDLTEPTAQPPTMMPAMSR